MSGPEAEVKYPGHFRSVTSGASGSPPPSEVDGAVGDMAEDGMEVSKSDKLCVAQPMNWGETEMGVLQEDCPVLVYIQQLEEPQQEVS